MVKYDFTNGALEELFKRKNEYQFKVNIHRGEESVLCVVLNTEEGIEKEEVFIDFDLSKEDEAVKCEYQGKTCKCDYNEGEDIGATLAFVLTLISEGKKFFR